MKLIIKSPNDFIITNGKLTSTSKFEVLKQGDSLIISGGGSESMSINENNISFSGNSCAFLSGTSSIGVCGDFRNILITQKKISFNGYSFSFKDGDLYINDAKYDKEDCSAAAKNDELKENEYLSYPLEKGSINSIAISSSAEFTIEDLSVLSEDDLSMAVQGSSTLLTSNVGHFVKSLNISVQGSGDIKMNKFQSNNCNCSVQGSGDILLDNSNFNILNLNVMGSGDITGRNTTSLNISKNIMGSGDINGFE